MSLLLDALKRAEAAKQQQGTAEGASPASGLSIEPSAGAAAEPAPPLMTRDRLPDITQPLEILSDDLPSSASPRADPPLAATPAARSGAQPRTRELKLDDDPAPEMLGVPREKAGGDREAVRQLFEAKGVDYDPYRFIKIVVVLAVGVVIGYGGYLYYQLQPRSAMVVNTSPPAAVQRPLSPAPAPISAAPAPQAAPAQSITPAPTPPAAAVNPPQAAVATPTPAPTAAPAKPATSPASPASARRASVPVAAQPRTAAPASPRGPAAPPRAATAVASGASAESPVESGYRALEAGDLQTARQEYSRALAMDRSNRDALLGLAAIDMKTQNYASAEARYSRVLEIDPRDPYAQAGMVTLRGQTDPVQSESRIKTLIAAQPDANFLNFTLGNQYAAQARWSEAQAAYFKAYSTDPENPDFAYNLAVSLDQLRQSRLALEYYQKALAASSSRPASFGRSQVEGRIRELSQ